MTNGRGVLVSIGQVFHQSEYPTRGRRHFYSVLYTTAPTRHGSRPISIFQRDGTSRVALNVDVNVPVREGYWPKNTAEVTTKGTRATLGTFTPNVLDSTRPGMRGHVKLEDWHAQC